MTNPLPVVTTGGLFLHKHLRHHLIPVAELNRHTTKSSTVYFILIIFTPAYFLLSGITLNVLLLTLVIGKGPKLTRYRLI